MHLITLIGAVLLSVLVEPTPLIAEHITVEPVIEQAPIQEEKTQEVEEPKSGIIQKVYDVANKYGVSAEEMIATINCESKFNNVQSYIVNNGIREDSHGIVQIHLPSNPQVTKEQAYDIDFSLDFMAKSFSEGKQRLWSCYRQLFP